MNRNEKTQVVEELKKTFEESLGVIVVEFKRVNVENITELRRKIRESGSQYRVVKNTLALRAAQKTPAVELSSFFSGPTAIAYTTEDAVALAKVIKDFVKDNPGMTFKAAILDGAPLNVEQVEALAEMPSREELLSKLMFLLKAPHTRLATALQSPLRNLAIVIKQLENQKQ